MPVVDASPGGRDTASVSTLAPTHLPSRLETGAAANAPSDSTIDGAELLVLLPFGDVEVATVTCGVAAGQRILGNSEV